MSACRARDCAARTSAGLAKEGRAERVLDERVSLAWCGPVNVSVGGKEARAV
jgi:hypothetical protein